MPETIGQRLKKARKYRNLSLEKVEDATHIRLQFLKALENDDFSAMPSPVQARGFLRNYAQYLDLDLDQMVEELRAIPVKPEPEGEDEVIFEEQQIGTVEKDQTEIEGEVSSEPFWQTWLRRYRQESGEFEEAPAPLPDQDSTPISELEPTPEEPVNEISRWEALLNLVNIRISHKQSVAESSLEEGIASEVESESEPQLETPSDVGPTSQEIINRIGVQLRQRREIISLSLEEIERHTRMRAQFLDALERGNFDDLPSPVQTRGMLANYASFLDLDVDEILLQFADALQARHRERHPENLTHRHDGPNIPSSIPTFRSFITGDIAFGVGIVLILVIFSLWGIARVISLQAEQEIEIQVEATGPSISEALIGTPAEAVEAEVTLIVAEDTPIPDLPGGTLEIATPALNVNVQVNVIAVERTFLRVTVDGVEAFNGRTIPGNAYSFEAEDNIEILAGNGAALRVIYNQRNLGLLGGFGEVASYVYTADEILTPTPEIPPTPTNTLFVSPTPSGTPTPTLTLVASPTDETE